MSFLANEQRGTYRSFRIILVSGRKPEIDKRAIAQILRNEAPLCTDRFGHHGMVAADELAEVLGIEPRRQRGRSDKIAEQNGQVPALWRGGYLRLRGSGMLSWRCGHKRRLPRAQLVDCRQQLAAMP